MKFTDDHLVFFALLFMALILAALLITFFITTLVAAGEQTRVNQYDLHGQRTGHVVIDVETGRVDYYDLKSQRTGWGRVDKRGTATFFGLDGRVRQDIDLPVRKGGKR